VQVTQAESIMVPSSTIVAPLLSVGVATTGVLAMLPLSSSTVVALPATILASMASPSLSSCPRVSLDHLYTSSDVDLLWGATYKLEQKTLVNFVSAFDKNLFRLAGVLNDTNFAKVFLQRSLAILEENGLRHQEAVQKVASLEADVAKWRATARTLWRVEHPKVANATIGFVEVVMANHQLTCLNAARICRLRRWTWVSKWS